MISKAKLKYIHSLEQKKYRRQEGVFVAEGPKVVGDLLAVMPARELFATREWMASQPHLTSNITEVTDDELRKLSFLQHPQQVLGVFETPDASVTAGLSSLTQNATKVESQLAIALDGVQDPGNLGTIIRIINLAELIDSLPAGTPVYGTLLNGENIYRQPLQPRGLIVMGNEGKGISPDIARRVSHRLLIPNYPEGRATADSLNVAIATAITCAEFRRQQLSF